MHILLRNQGLRYECNQISVLKTVLMTCCVCVSIAFHSDVDNYILYMVEFMINEKRHCGMNDCCTSESRTLAENNNQCKSTVNVNAIECCV